MLTLGAVKSGLRIEWFVKRCPLSENLANAGAIDFPIIVSPNSICESGRVVEFM